MRFRLVLIGVSSALFLSACDMVPVADTYNSMPYDDTMAFPHDYLEKSDTAQALNLIPIAGSDVGSNLQNLEMGRFQQIAQDYSASITSYQRVIDSVADDANHPYDMIEEGMANSLAYFNGGYGVKYHPRGYEVIALYTYQALNELALGNTAAANSDIEKALALQSTYHDLLNKQLQKIEQLSQSEDSMNSQYPDSYRDMVADTSAVKTSFFNPLSVYLASLLQQANGNAVEASNYLDEIKAAGVNNPYLKTLDPKQAGLVIIYEPMLLDHMSDETVKVNANGVIWDMYMPSYESYNWMKTYATPPLVISRDSQPLGKTENLLSYRQLAEKSLIETYPFYELMLQNYINHADLSEIKFKIAIFSNFNRNKFDNSWEGMPYQLAWSTLPEDVQIFQESLAEGSYNLTLSNVDASNTVTVYLQSGKITIVWVIQPGDSTLFTGVINL